MIRVALVDDHTLFRNGLKMLLSRGIQPRNFCINTKKMAKKREVATTRNR